MGGPGLARRDSQAYLSLYGCCPPEPLTLLRNERKPVLLDQWAGVQENKGRVTWAARSVPAMGTTAENPPTAFGGPSAAQMVAEVATLGGLPKW